MPTEERGSISHVKPTGWQTAKYDIVDGKYLYNRCHLIGFQLTGENANKQNLITGTRYFNVDGMLPFENMVADYVKETENHVLYRVTPVFQGNNLFSKGACYGARERVLPSTLSKDYVYLSEEKLKANIGIECNRGTEKTYQPLLDAGTNWFEAKREIDFILAKENRMPITETPLDGGRPRVAEITLEGMQIRGNRTNRIGLTVSMENADTVVIEVVDKGFGEFFPATGQIWRECFSLEQVSGNS